MAEASKVPVKTEGNVHRPAEWRPFDHLRREIDRLFDDLHWSGRLPSPRSLFGAEPSWRGEFGWNQALAVDVVEKGGAYEITAELPGIDGKNVDVKYADGALTISGEKKEEKEEKKKDYHLSERRYGAFQRSFQLPNGIDADKIDAVFKNGVLTVKLPKTAEAVKQEKKIEIKTAA